MNSPVFGPVPSRRLGRSLGVNNVIGKTCTYNCVYCQAGRTEDLTIRRRRFYDPEQLIDQVLKRVDELEKRGEKIDYVTFVPNGEPSLDINVGREASAIKEAGLRVAIISNGSLLWMDDVRSDLGVFDLVSVKLDAVTPRLWRIINRPHPNLSIKEIINGMKAFSETFNGELLTETMLINNIDYAIEAKLLAETIASLKPSRVYIMVPVRPPAEQYIEPPSTETVLHVYETFRERIGDKVYLLTGPEEGSFIALGNAEKEILSIISVHPLRLDQVVEILDKYGVGMDVVNKLVSNELAAIIEYMGTKYLVRRSR